MEDETKVDQYIPEIEEVVSKIGRPKLDLNLLHPVKGKGEHLVWFQITVTARIWFVDISQRVSRSQEVKSLMGHHDSEGTIVQNRGALSVKLAIDAKYSGVTCPVTAAVEHQVTLLVKPFILRQFDLPYVW